MNRFLQFNYHFGITKLLPEWKKMFSPQYFSSDLFAGMTVALVAIPLSLAIALASGVSPGTGLITAIIAGLVCAFFGGTTLGVSGPAAAMSILIADIVEKFGVTALILICFIAGTFQLLSGFLGFGKLGKFVPLPVIAGFTAGIGIIIIVGQLPRAFGLEPPPESHIFQVILHLKEYLHHINANCIFLVAITMGFIYGLPKMFPKVPSVLPAVILTTSIVYFFNLNDVPLIGNIPRSLPSPHFPEFPKNISLQDLIFNSFIIYLLASLETLLSSSAIDKLTNEKKHDSDQELIGQGLANISVSFFGGIPVTGVIARSATNVRSGAKTRRASVIHSLIILLSVFFVAPLIALIPIAALSAVLFTVAVSMVNYREFYNLWLTGRYEAIIYAVTFGTIIFVDLLAGVQAGIIAACLIVLYRATKTHLNISTNNEDGITRISCIGALTFLSTAKINDLQKVITNHHNSLVLLDLSNIRNVDMSGAMAVVELYHFCKNLNIKLYLQGLPRRFESLFMLCTDEGFINECYLISEQELKNKEVYNAPKSSRGRLVHGVNRFYAETMHNDKRLFEYISKQQNPHTLFVACSDSRVIPSTITSTDPGELFIIRNIGNFIPPYKINSEHSEAAALEFALANFDISDIVICGHANCGAINACLNPNMQIDSSLKLWIEEMRKQFNDCMNIHINDAVKLNAVNQLAHLKCYPIVQDKLKNKTLNLHAWFFDFSENMVYEWNKDNFKSIVKKQEVREFAY